MMKILKEFSENDLTWQSHCNACIQSESKHLEGNHIYCQLVTIFLYRSIQLFKCQTLQHKLFIYWH